MGKSKKLKPSQMASKVSLEQDIEHTKFAQPKNRNKVRNRQDEEEQFVEAGLSNKILKIAREQQRELKPESNPQCSFQTSLMNCQDSESEDDDPGDSKEYDSFFDNIQISQEDEEAMKKFMSTNPKPRRNLADSILEKMTEKKTELESHFSNGDNMPMEDLDPALVKVFEGCGDMLKRYRSGKIPTAFKFLHKYTNWEQLLYLTNPSSWSAAAMYQATRIFASNLNEKMAQKFYDLVLLPRVRDDLAEYKKLNFHLYQALRKALYKPKAFIKGILIPLLESGDCTLREAIIIGSIVANNSIPCLHSSTAIFKIVEMDYTGANSIFLRIFLDKKYALPYKVVDAICEHFMRFQFDKREMPVLWHQSLLTFVQRYKADITSETRDTLSGLLKKHYHPAVSPEIERELRHAKCRDLIIEEPSMDF